jgi:uncharacterized protein (DUF4415 family)
MTKKSGKPEFIAGQGFSKADWDAVDSPHLTKAELAQVKPFAEAFPELAEKMRKSLGGRPPLARPKRAVSIRLDQDVIDKFKASGPGWQSRINDLLKKAVA